MSVPLIVLYNFYKQNENLKSIREGKLLMAHKVHASST